MVCGSPPPRKACVVLFRGWRPVLGPIGRDPARRGRPPGRPHPVGVLHDFSTPGAGGDPCGSISNARGVRGEHSRRCTGNGASPCFIRWCSIGCFEPDIAHDGAMIAPDSITNGLKPETRAFRCSSTFGGDRPRRRGAVAEVARPCQPRRPPIGPGSGVPTALGRVGGLRRGHGGGQRRDRGSGRPLAKRARAGGPGEVGGGWLLRRLPCHFGT